MKRNRDRMYYDKGYSDGVKNAKKNRRIPKLVGAVILLAVATVDVLTAWAFLFTFAVFEVTEWYDNHKYHDPNPPPAWEDSNS